MLKLKSVVTEGDTPRVTYDVSHSPAKGDKAAALEARPVTLAIHPDGAAASVDVGEFYADTEDGALDALAAALESAAAGIRGRGTASLSVPIFGS